MPGPLVHDLDLTALATEGQVPASPPGLLDDQGEGRSPRRRWRRGVPGIVSRWASNSWPSTRTRRPSTSTSTSRPSIFTKYFMRPPGRRRFRRGPFAGRGRRPGTGERSGGAEGRRRAKKGEVAGQRRRIAADVDDSPRSRAARIASTTLLSIPVRGGLVMTSSAALEAGHDQFSGSAAMRRTRSPTSGPRRAPPPGDPAQRSRPWRRRRELRGGFADAGVEIPDLEAVESPSCSTAKRRTRSPSAGWTCSKTVAGQADPAPRPPGGAPPSGCHQSVARRRGLASSRAERGGAGPGPFARAAHDEVERATPVQSQDRCSASGGSNPSGRESAAQQPVQSRGPRSRTARDRRNPTAGRSDAIRSGAARADGERELGAGSPRPLTAPRSARGRARRAARSRRSASPTIGPLGKRAGPRGSRCWSWQPPQASRS